MKKTLLAGVAALSVLYATANAREFQCGHHFVETSGFIQVIAGIFWNRTRDNHLEKPLGKIDEMVVWAIPIAIEEGHSHPSKVFYYNKDRSKMYHRGKACVEYKEESEQPLTDEEKWREKDRKAEEFWRQWQADKANAQNQSETTNPAWLERYHRLKEECVQLGFHGAIGGCLLEKDKEHGKELDQAYRKALTLAGTNKPLLRESQRSWLKYQESTCKLNEVLTTSEGEGVARLSVGGCLLGMTLQRLEELRWMADCFNGRCAD